MRDRERHMSRAELARSALVNLATASSQVAVACHELQALGFKGAPIEELRSIAERLLSRLDAFKERLSPQIERTEEEGTP